jgi:hypothetical protein
LWHGFLLPEEYEVHYTSFLLVLSMSLPSAIEILCNYRDLRRKSQDVSIFDAHLPLVWRGNMFYFTFQLMNLNVEEKLSLSQQQIRTLIEQSCFILPGKLPLWQSAFQYFSEGMYLHSLALLFPELEHRYSMNAIELI